MKNNKKHIYIIGNVPQSINEDIVEQFRHAELDLISMGFKVYNPISSLSRDTGILSQESRIKNVQTLFTCDAVYILPSVVLNDSNLELRVAILLDLLVIHGIDKRHDTTKRKKKDIKSI